MGSRDTKLCLENSNKKADHRSRWEEKAEKEHVKEEERGSCLPVDGDPGGGARGTFGNLLHRMSVLEHSQDLAEAGAHFFSQSLQKSQICAQWMRPSRAWSGSGLAA